LRSTREVRKPNLQVDITHASQVCSQHSFGFPPLFARNSLEVEFEWGWEEGGGGGCGWLLSRNNNNSKFIYVLATHLYSICHQFTMLVCLFSDLVKSKIEANGFLNKLARRESDLAEAQRTTYTEECCVEGCKVEEISEYCGHLL